MHLTRYLHPVLTLAIVMSTVIGFDLYGTLLSTASISRELATLYGEEKATRIAAEARRHQLEYTWRINSMGICTFASLNTFNSDTDH